MTTDALNLIKALFNGAWRIMTCFNIPGTNITPAMLCIGGFVVGVSVRVIVRIVGFGSVGSADVRTIDHFFHERY